MLTKVRKFYKNGQNVLKRKAKKKNKTKQNKENRKLNATLQTYSKNKNKNRRRSSEVKSPKGLRAAEGHGSPEGLVWSETWRGRRVGGLEGRRGQWVTEGGGVGPWSFKQRRGATDQDRRWAEGHGVRRREVTAACDLGLSDSGPGIAEVAEGSAAQGWPGCWRRGERHRRARLRGTRGGGSSLLTQVGGELGIERGKERERERGRVG